MLISKDLAKWMKQRRKIMDKSYEEIAKETGVSKHSLFRIFYAQSDVSERLITQVLEYLGHSDIDNTIKHLRNNQDSIKEANCEYTLTVKERIKKQLKDNSIEQITLANEMGVSRQYIHSVLNTATLSKKMAKKINTTIEEIINKRGKHEENY